VVESPSSVIPDPVQEVPVVESPSSVIPDPVQEVPVIESPSSVIPNPVQEVPVVESPAPIADPVPPPATVPDMTGWPQHWIDRYNRANGVKPTAIPEPGTVVALLVTGAGILCSARKRNKQVRQQR
ncbi:PEP-CTERM sorting domain-containing protein, partial [Microcoleus sp. herbarium2]|uniref:PEP-CTERM sorting domain-containing protein n=1 Tax=Microcoleus sp. herbarium2 TaxID=3055433 RepID=UPI002FD3E0D3